jgi:hypothetical protein
VASGTGEVLATEAIRHSYGKGSVESGSCGAASGSYGVDSTIGAGDTTSRGIFIGLGVDIGVTIA